MAVYHATGIALEALDWVAVARLCMGVSPSAVATEDDSGAASSDAAGASASSSFCASGAGETTLEPRREDALEVGASPAKVGTS